MNKADVLAKLQYFNMVHGVTLRAIATLADEDLDFRPRPNMRSPKELIFHIYAQEKILADAVRLGKGVDFVGQWVVVIVAVEQEVPQSRKGPLRVEAGGGVKFHPIAGRDDDRLVGHA